MAASAAVAYTVRMLFCCPRTGRTVNVPVASLVDFDPYEPHHLPPSVAAAQGVDETLMPMIGRGWTRYLSPSDDERWFQGRDDPNYTDADGTIYTREADPIAIPAAHVTNHEVRHTGNGIAQASRSLPRRTGGTPDTVYGQQVLRHADGGLTDLLGRPIVATRRDRDREQRRTGFEFSDSPDTTTTE